jgi:hypothetical protein
MTTIVLGVLALVGIFVDIATGIRYERIRMARVVQVEAELVRLNKLMVTEDEWKRAELVKIETMINANKEAIEATTKTSQKP